MQRGVRNLLTLLFLFLTSAVLFGQTATYSVVVDQFGNVLAPPSLLTNINWRGNLSFPGTTNGGLIVKSLTTTQMNAVTPTNGMIIFNTTGGAFYGYQNGWSAIGSGGGGGGNSNYFVGGQGITNVVTSGGGNTTNTIIATNIGPTNLSIVGTPTGYVVVLTNASGVLYFAYTNSYNAGEFTNIVIPITNYYGATGTSAAPPVATAAETVANLPASCRAVLMESMASGAQATFKPALALFSCTVMPRETSANEAAPATEAALVASAACKACTFGIRYS